MSFNQALDKTLDHFGISGKWLAKQSGLSQQMISGFRQGHQQVRSDSLEKMIRHLPMEAQQHFYAQLGGSTLSLETMIGAMDNADLAKVLAMISEKLQHAENAKPRSGPPKKALAA
jgi:predicted transcriptional regulator